MRLQPYSAPISAEVADLRVRTLHRAGHWRGKFKHVYIMISKKQWTVSLVRKEYFLQFRYDGRCYILYIVYCLS